MAGTWLVAMARDHLFALPEGHELAGYRFGEVLGSGGYGITYKGEDFSNGSIEIEPFGMRRSALGESSNTSHYFAGSLPVANDIADSFTQFPQVRGIGGEPSQAGAAIAHDAR